MDVLNRILPWRKYRRNADVADDDSYIEEIELNNLRESSADGCTKVVQYYIDQETGLPSMIDISSFHGDSLPQQGSVIWAPNRAHDLLVPYKVVRIDYMEDDAGVQSAGHMQLIVVQQASVYEITRY